METSIFIPVIILTIKCLLINTIRSQEFYLPGPDLQHECTEFDSAKENEVTENLNIFEKFTAIVIHSPARCLPEDLLRKKTFFFRFSNDVAKECTMTVYCKNFHGMYCDNYFISLYVQPTHLSQEVNMDLRVQRDKICSTERTYQVTLQEHMQMVLEVNYPKRPEVTDFFNCGVYYKCEGKGEGHGSSHHEWDDVDKLYQHSTTERTNPTYTTTTTSETKTYTTTTTETTTYTTTTTTTETTTYTTTTTTTETTTYTTTTTTTETTTYSTTTTTYTTTTTTYKTTTTTYTTTTTTETTTYTTTTATTKTTTTVTTTYSTMSTTTFTPVNTASTATTSYKTTTTSHPTTTTRRPYTKRPGRIHKSHGKRRFRQRYPYVITTKTSMTFMKTKKKVFIPHDHFYYLDSQEEEDSHEYLDELYDEFEGDGNWDQKDDDDDAKGSTSHYYPPTRTSSESSSTESYPRTSTESYPRTSTESYPRTSTESYTRISITTPSTVDERFNLACPTANGNRCVTGTWIWSEGPGNTAHYVNCVPMTREGRNLYDISVNQTSILGQDFDYFCPTRINSDRRVDRNQKLFYNGFDRCLTSNNVCLTNKTLEQEFSPRQKGICFSEKGNVCVPDVWKDERGRWYRGCRQVGKLRPRFECATKSDNQGKYIEIEECSTDSGEECLQGISDLKPAQGNKNWILL